MASNVFKAVLRVQADDVAGEVCKAVTAAVSGRNLRAMHARETPRQRDPVNLFHEESVMLQEGFVVVTVRQIALTGTVDVQSGPAGSRCAEWWRVNRKVDGFFRKFLHHLNRVAVVNCIIFADFLFNYSHAGTSAFVSNFTPRSSLNTSFMRSTIFANN